MELNKSIKSRRVGVILNFLLLALIIFQNELIRFDLLPQNYKYLKIILIVFILITHFSFFGKTGLWKFTHKRKNDLDERELELSNQALRFSYSVFAVLIISFLYIFNWLNFKVTMIEIGSFLYLAHVLPAYYISWTEKSITEND